MPTFKITVAYDGTAFVGWQRQAKGTSIQGLIEEELRPLDGRGVAVHGAGRTDAGVHAIGQVASFTLARAIEAGSVMKALNSRLPPDVRIVSAEEVDPTFHARFRAHSKTYCYRIVHGGRPDPFQRAYAWQVAGILDLASMQAAARLLEGRHDFAAFRASGGAVKTTEREVTAIRVAAAGHAGGVEEGPGSGERSLRVPRVPGGGELVTIEITGTGFLRHMVRIVVGSLVEIGRGRRDLGWLAQVLDARDRRLAGPTAPPQGLFLAAVAYGASVLADEP